MKLLESRSTRIEIPEKTRPCAMSAGTVAIFRQRHCRPGAAFPHKQAAIYIGF